MNSMWPEHQVDALRIVHLTQRLILIHFEKYNDNDFKFHLSSDTKEHHKTPLVKANTDKFKTLVLQYIDFVCCIALLIFIPSSHKTLCQLTINCSYWIFFQQNFCYARENTFQLIKSFYLFYLIPILGESEISVRGIFMYHCVMTRTKDFSPSNKVIFMNKELGYQSHDLI